MKQTAKAPLIGPPVNFLHKTAEFPLQVQHVSVAIHRNVFRCMPTSHPETASKQQVAADILHVPPSASAWGPFGGLDDSTRHVETHDSLRRGWLGAHRPDRRPARIQ